MEKTYVHKESVSNKKASQEKAMEEFAKLFPQVKVIYIDYEWMGWDKHHFLVCVFDNKDMKPSDKAKLNGTNHKGYVQQ